MRSKKYSSTTQNSICSALNLEIGFQVTLRLKVFPAMAVSLKGSGIFLQMYNLIFIPYSIFPYLFRNTSQEHSAVLTRY